MEIKSKLTLCTAGTLSLMGCAKEKEVKPNIIVILADDLGYGDVSAYGAQTIHTPNIDRLGNEGVKFMNGYATSATSTPSRYALMTGMYPWKKRPKSYRVMHPLSFKSHNTRFPK